MKDETSLTAEQAFDLYERVRHRLPSARFPASSIRVESLSEMANEVDAFILDAFGVLNVGQTPIPGAVARMAELRARGKQLIVLTNSASDTRDAALRKYRTLGFDFTPEEVLASRDVAAARLDRHLPGGIWGAICTDVDGFADFGATIRRWTATDRPDVDGFLLLSSAGLDLDTETALTGALLARPRPVVIANPDIVAPRESGLSREPGFFAHRLAERTGIDPVFYGKPFTDAFDDVRARLNDIDANKIAMVGDTLHTDVLGGAAAGLKTVLVSDHGLFAGKPVDTFIDRSGIRPDYICRTT